MALRKRFRQQPSVSPNRQQKRRHLLETLEPRQLLAGPQLIGVQPNQGALIDDGAVRSVAPRSLTFRFDESQQIDPSTFEGIRITRAGGDGTFGTGDDVVIVPGLVTLGDIRQNEVVVRFAENLPDDHYRIDVFAFDDPGQGVVALRNVAGEILVPSIPGARAETINFKLNLGALVEAVVPQPIVRLSDGSLDQRRNEILIYFNEDELFVENDPATGLPTARSVENPRFYQLLLTRDTVRTTDDALYFPQRVIYDAATHTARLIFEADINDLPAKDGQPGVPISGGTFRLRIGTAVDNRSDLILAPLPLTPAGQVGGTLATAFDLNVGVSGDRFVTDGSKTSSVLISGSIAPLPFGIQLPGSLNDQGRLRLPDGVGGGLAQTINERFGADSRDAITEIQYNFRSVFAGGAGTGLPSQLNNITEIQKRRVREALSLWSNYLGVQFRETKDTGITFAVGSTSALSPRPGTQLQTIGALNSTLRIDPQFNDSAMVLSNQVSYGLNYGEDFFRKTMAGVGFLLGLEQASELPGQTLMSLSSVFLNESINPAAFLAPVDPFVPLQTSRQQSINDAIDSQTIGTPLPNALSGFEPVFPGNYDILHGQFLHRPDSTDIDLYRFEVKLGAGQQTGTLTAETFAERLADSSLLDTTLTLFQSVSASATTDFGLGTTVSVRIDSLLPGALGNHSRIEFVQSDRAAGNTAVRVTRIADESGQFVDNAIRVDIPRRGPNVASVSVGQVIDAINSDAFARTLFNVVSVVGRADRGEDVSGTQLANFSPIRLSGGDTVAIARNDNYIGNDSLITTQLANGVYYLGISAAGNDRYDPTLSDSGYGGRTQGKYELQLTFRPQVNQTDAIRDRDSARVGVPGTALDGDGDGVPGGEKNFWFQTRPLERMMDVTVTGAGIVAGQTMTVTGANGVNRRFEFVPEGGSAQSGNIAIFYRPGPTPTPASQLADRIRGAISSVRLETGVSAAVATGTSLITLSGERSLQLSSNFRGLEIFGRTIFVDKTASVVTDGSLARPFNNIASTTLPSAFSAALPQDIVRIVGNGGQDNNLATPGDNFSYQIGLAEIGGNVLPDGRHMDVPKGVTVMIDAGAAFKLRGAAISVGSNNLLADRSGGALQVLGTPRLVRLNDPVFNGTSVIDVGVNLIGNSGSVVFTSTRDRGVDAAASGNSPAAAAGNWGGLIFRRDFDQAEGRRDVEDEGIFLQSVNHADIRFGGGSNIVINSLQQTVNPIQMINLRPTLTFNRLSNNAGAAMSASPDSFEETRFQEPRFQQAGAFTADYDRIGPDIKNNRLVDNSINGLFIRTENVGNQPPRKVTVAARFDDVDIVHYIAENIVIAGRPGGSIQDGFVPDFASVTTRSQPGARLPAGTYQYRMTFVDASGFESLASEATSPVTTTGSGSSIQLLNLPVISSGSDYLFRRLYRLDSVSGEYRLIAQLNRSSATFTDDGSAPLSGAQLDLSREGIRGRINGSLVIDPNIVVKFRGARIELDHGTQLLAEGLPGQPVVFTSSLDDRYGAGGTFDTNNDSRTPGGGSSPRRGDWSGIYAGPTAHVSLDHAVIAYGGGVSLIEGGQSRGFLALELQQASARVTNSRFEYNDHGQAGSGPVGRNGRLAITPATIFVRGSQPVIVDNEFVDNFGSIIDISLASMTDQLIADLGRQSGPIDRLVGLDDNHGPLIRRNTTDNTPSDLEGRRQLNGLRVRGGQLTTGSVWDDTDIAHVLFDSVIVGNQVSGGALTLKSRPDESLVIKMLGGGTPNSASLGTGFTATGSKSDIPDRIGGTIHVLGLPGSPVVFTSLKDDTVGAGRKLDGTAQTDTNGDGFGSRPMPNDWRSLYFDALSNDRNVAVLQEHELSTALAPGLNATINSAQFLGALAERLTASDDELRLGFEVHGFLSGRNDIDTYSFTGVAGTQVWIDIDHTAFTLDSVIEILDNDGNVLSRSVNSFDEVNDPSLIQVNGPVLQNRVRPLADNNSPYTERWESGMYADFGSTNPRDAGLRLALPGATGTRSNYFVRIRSASVDPADASAGLTQGSYSFQVRLQEAQEFPGSVVRFADIRFANHGIHVQGLPGSSPLLGEVQENESVAPSGFGLGASSATNGGFRFSNIDSLYPSDVYADNGTIVGGSYLPAPPFGFPTLPGLGTSIPPMGARPQYLGNLVDSKAGTISVGGSLSSISDVDFYRLDVRYDNALSGLQRSTVFDMDYADGFDRPDTNLSIFYSPTGNPNDARLVLFGQDSNILDDRTSPLTTDEVGELLARGSRGDGDPFVGPISLPQGTYFVAVTESSRLPLELQNNPLARREPLDSVLRIFEDHVESIGGSTATAPREGAFVETTSPGWSVTTNRGTDLGHQRTASFNGSRTAPSNPTSTQFESEPNDTFALANDLESIPWSVAFNANIGSMTGNTSQSIPHTSVFATTTGDVVDIFRFQVPQNNSLVILDVDNGFDPQFPDSFSSVDVKMQLFREDVDPTTGAVTRVLVQTNNNAPASYGAGGSQAGLPDGLPTTQSADPFIQTTLDAGTYYLAVSPEATTYDPATGLFTLAAANRPASGSYTLHVSVANHSFAGGNAANQSYRFNRSEPEGTLTSAAFDLAGYSAADLPRFYFDYFYSAGPGDSVTVQARSDQQPDGMNLNVALLPPPNLQTWRQAVVSLEAFAGHTGIEIEFVYRTGSGPSSAEGLYLDNFIVGFAERGEMVTGAVPGQAGFSTALRGTPGEYQLEIRPGSEYVQHGAGRIQLTHTFDTNDRHARQVTLVAPAGDQINNGDRFTLSDGTSTLTFEFSSTSTVGSGNIRIPFSTTDSATTVARRIITAINSGIVQGNLTLRASTAEGYWDFDNPTSPDPAPTDPRVALHGSAVGNFAAVPTASEAPAPDKALPKSDDGHLILSAIYHDGVGDRNTLRTQGQVIIDSNRISDARAIGIWNDVGYRGTDPDDVRRIANATTGGAFLQPPPVGNSQLGAVLNLPTLNDSVRGGIVPGVVVVNNIIDQAGFAGVKVDGETRPFVIEWDGITTNYASGNTVLQSRADILVPDGFMFAIDAGGTRVVFEFEDINGAPTNVGGSGVVGGDGFIDGHVPVYYRLGRGGETYNPNGPHPIRSHGYSGQELMMAIYEAIQGSILVTNGLVELVRPTLGPSLTNPSGPRLRTIDNDPILGGFFGSRNTLDFANPAIYLQGVTGIYTSPAFQKSGFTPRLSFSGTSFNPTTGETFTPSAPLSPVYEAPQPLARLINNTIYGADGTEGAILVDGSLSRAIGLPTNEPNDSIANAADTKLGVSHRGAYIAQGRIGDNTGPLSADRDIDFFEVQLSVGDRLIVDIDTLDGGPTTVLRLFDSRGLEVARGERGTLPSYLRPGSTVEFPVSDVANNRDSFIDFTVLKTDTYYIGISSAGNAGYEALSLAGRTAGTGGTGDYTIGIEVLAPRSFVFSLDNHPLTPFGAEVLSGTLRGTQAQGGPAGARSLIGTTFTISQIPDYLIPTRPGDAYANVNAEGNRVTFEFTGGQNRIVLANGNINVPILENDFMTGGGYRVPDIMRAISNAINGYLNNPALPNHEVGNGPGGSNGPVSRVKARALGGSQTDNIGIANFIREVGFPQAPTPGGGFDFTTGFGHDRRESGGTASIVPDGTFTDGRGTTELYVLIENAAKIELSPEARAAGLKLGPDNSRLANGNPRNPGFATESDQVLTEFGILVSSGASAAVLNNVVINAHQSIVKDESSVFGFGGRIDANNPDRNVKPGQVVLTGNAIQYDEQRNTQIRSDVSWWVNPPNVINRNPVLDGSISTDLRTGPSNIRGGNSDFNFVVSPAGTPGQAPGNFTTFVFGDLLEGPARNRFTPARNAPIIDSAVDSILENTALASLKASLGIPSGLVLAPERDNSGQLRADEPTMAPPGGIGSNVFKDRGALDRADFVGPVATLDFPFDNDAAGVDSDPAESFLRLTSGVYNEFRILLQDLGDASDPFVGTGIDNATVVVSRIPGLRENGAAIALFEGDRLLVEGIDYTFSYDETRHLITLRPLAGIWRDDRAYRITINNRDRQVAIAPGASAIADGDTFTVIDTSGGRLTFEFESGYELIVPETLQFTVPAAATGAGGIMDGTRFSITGVNGAPVFFEFNLDDTLLPGSREVRYAIGDTREQIAASAAQAITAAAQQGLINVDVAVDGAAVIIGSERGTVLDASRTALRVAPRTLGLLVPSSGVGPTGVNDGDVLTINDGTQTIRFEFEISGGIAPGNIGISLAGVTQAEGVRNAIFDAITASSLNLSPMIVGEVLYLNLPAEGTASVSRGQLAPVGISRTPADGSTITFTPRSGGPVTVVLDRTDVVGPLPEHDARVEFTRLTTGNQLARRVAAVLRSLQIDGLNSAAVIANSGGQVAIGGEPGLGLSLDGGSALQIIGQPGVLESSVLTVAGPLLAQLPIVGGSGMPDDSQFRLSDGVNTVTFQYNLVLTGASNPQAIQIPYRSFDDANAIANATVAAINASVLNITASNVGGGRISLGNISESQFSIPPAAPGAPVVAAPLTLRRGIVGDGEQIVITQGAQTLRLEFDAAIGGGGVAPGFIPVVFQPGSTIDNVASVLAAAINNNRGSMNLSASAISGGRVQLNDTAQTVINVSAAPTIALSGTPGGAIAVRFNGAFGPEEMKRALIAAINQANAQGTTPLRATNRGGGTLFIENASLIEGPLANYFLQAVKDLAGNPLKPNREDNTTQFTLLLPTVGLDYGDAPDPRGGVAGRYPTMLTNDGARHIVDASGVRLGRLIDIDPDGMPSRLADGDDTTVFVLRTNGPLFDAVVRPGFVEVSFNLTGSPASFDGNTVTISTGVDTATLEFDVDGLFNENNFAVAPSNPTSLASIAEAFARAVRESPLRPADVVVVGNTVRVITDDEDGVVFTSDVNPGGILNPGIPLEITVTVAGSGVLEAWVDFNFDGDWDDPNEQIISFATHGDRAIFAGDANGEPTTRTFVINVPATAPRPSAPTLTYARFRISTEGGLSPRGLALSGEVEDYALTILPGLPPNVNATNAALTYRFAEDGILQARDGDGTLTPGAANDNGILAAIRDPDGDQIGIFADDVGDRTLIDAAGNVAGELTLFADGTFTFVPTPNYFGTARFTARVTDLKPQAPETQLVSSTPITVTINVDPVNDRPFVSGPQPVITRTIAEDTVITFTAAELTAFYLPGPPNESSQPLSIQSVGVGGLGFQTELGGTVQIINGTVRYTPPANFPGPGPDRFHYVVADDPMDPNQLVETAATLGTVVITITPVNDAPIVGNDSFSFEGDGPFSLSIGAPGVAGSILGNDVAGPPDEVAGGQTIALVRSEFPKATLRGGTVSISANGQNLVYTPPANFSGPDQFSYTVIDTGSPAASATGTVFLTVDGDNAAPVFVGINGDPNRRSLQFNESKEVEQVLEYNLNSWFVDPEGDSSTFTVTSSDPSVVNASVIVDPATGAATLRLRLPSFRFGQATLDIVATNVGGGPSGTAQVPVTVTNTPDPPVLIGSLDPLSANEDQVITRDLSQVFSDPDGGLLNYSVSRIGNILNPTAAQITASGLVQSISFSGNQMTIRLVGDASGSVPLEITASDGTFSVAHAFTLNVAPVPDAPRSQENFYNVPVGGRLQVLNPAQGVLSNDTDPDSDVFQGTNQKLRVHLPSVTQPSLGTLEINADGTFVYTNTSGQTGAADTFTYQAIDPTGRLGNVVTVTLNIGGSRYQNPIPGFNFDVNADGAITPLDALLVLNVLAANRSSDVLVSSLNAPPPPFYDVNGDGRVQPLDALMVINEIGRRNRLQMNQNGEGELAPALLASAGTLYAASSIGLPEAGPLPVLDGASTRSASAADRWDAFSFEMDLAGDDSDRLAEDLLWVRHGERQGDGQSQAVDEVLLNWMEPTNL